MMKLNCIVNYTVLKLSCSEVSCWGFSKLLEYNYGLVIHVRD